MYAVSRKREVSSRGVDILFGGCSLEHFADIRSQFVEEEFRIRSGLDKLSISMRKVGVPS